jgi:hypothetical protein
MTRDDFEKITALDAVKTGKVTIELHFLGGFVVIGSRRTAGGMIARVRETISFAAFEAVIASVLGQI